jgi:hypothetical protein
MPDREYTKEEKLSKLFAVVLQLEEYQRMTESRLAELSGFKIAMRPKNIVYLMQSELRCLNDDISWAKEILNAPSKD